MQFNLHAVPDLVVSVYTLSLGTFAFISNSKNPKNRWFFFLTILTFFWLFSYGVSFLFNDPVIVRPILKFGHLSATFITPVIYFFMLAILGEYKKRLDVWLGRICVLLVIPIPFLLYFTDTHMAGIRLHYWGYFPVGGPSMIIYAGWTFIIAIRAYYVLREAGLNARKHLDFENYQQFRYYTLSIAVFMPASIEYLAKFTTHIYPCGAVFVGAFASLVTYAIVKHKILDVEIIIKRSFLYSALIFILTFFYLAIVLIGEYVFRSVLGYKSILIALFASSVIALSFNSMRERLQKAIDRFFYKKNTAEIVRENVLMKDELQKQDRLKAVATLAAGMAHEIKNPLSSIRTFAEHLSTKYDDPEFRAKFERIVVDEVDRINNIVQQLLDFSKPRELTLKEEDLAAILDETLALLNSNLLKSKVLLVRNYSQTLRFPVDRNQLKQALLNILLNAIQAMPKGGQLTVSLQQSKSGATELLISDSGEGILEKDIPRIFDPFFSTKETGTGLGLAIVHGIITQHGGRISVQSSGDAGTCFKITF